MTDAAQLQILGAYVVFFLWTLAGRLGLPLPAGPFLVAAGTLAKTGRMSLAIALALVGAASLAGDVLWYELGRRLGSKVLGWLCHISLQPDSCVRRSENFFAKHGPPSLLVAKFLPGLSTVAPTLAGSLGVSRRRFVFYDSLGALLWGAAYLGTGYVFSDRLEQVASYVFQSSSLLAAAALLAALATYLGGKYVRRRRLLRRLQVPRITPEDLKQRLESGEPLAIVDLRHPLDFLASPYLIPRAIRIPLEELDLRHQEIPRDRDVVLYCTCPTEASSARALLLLRQRGIWRASALIGGFHKWRHQGYPLQPYDFDSAPATAPSR